MVTWLAIGAVLLVCLALNVHAGHGKSKCVWNQAYNEDVRAESIDEIINKARGCFVLIDPFDMGEPEKTISEIKKGGNVVACYISVGTCETCKYRKKRDH